MKDESLNSYVEEALFNTWEYMGTEEFGLTEFARYNEFIFEFSEKLIEAYNDAKLFEKSPSAYLKLQQTREKEQQKQDIEFNSIMGLNKNGKNKTNKKQTKKR